MGWRHPPPLRAGIALHGAHLGEFLECPAPVGFVEAPCCECSDEVGAPPQSLVRLRDVVPVSLGDARFAIAASARLDERRLAAVARLVDRIEPVGLCDSLGDATPVPCTEATLAHVVPRLHAIQERIGRRVLVANPPSCRPPGEGDISEPEFLAEMARRSGCGLLLDLAGLHAGACRFGFDPVDWLDALPAGLVAQVRLAGHDPAPRGTVTPARAPAVATRDRPVGAAVWGLFRHALARFGTLPAVIEWTDRVPALDVLVLEAARADRVAAEARRAWLA